MLAASSLLARFSLRRAAACRPGRFLVAFPAPAFRPTPPLRGRSSHVIIAARVSGMATDMDTGGADKTAPRPFPVEDIIQHPLPGYAIPGAIAFSPGDALVCSLYSPEGTLHRKLYAFDPATGAQRLLAAPPGGGLDEASLSAAEKLRRERLRERGLGVTRYEWAGAGGNRLLIPLPDGLYIQDGVAAPLTLLYAAPVSDPVQDPQLSPDGNWVAFVQRDELYVMLAGPPLAAGAAGGTVSIGNPPTLADLALGVGPWPRQLTGLGGGGGVGGGRRTRGLAEYIAQEEMERRGGFWWSSDSRKIAFCEVDNDAVPLYRIPHMGPQAMGRPVHEEHPYPFAGQANAVVRLGVVGVGGGVPVMLDLSCGAAGVAAVAALAAATAAAGRTPPGSHPGTLPGSHPGTVDAEASATTAAIAAAAAALANAPEEYLARVTWLPDGDLGVQIQNRAQTVLQLVRFCAVTGQRRAARATGTGQGLESVIHGLESPSHGTGPGLGLGLGYRAVGGGLVYDAEPPVATPGNESGENSAIAVSGGVILTERSPTWINLHDMLKPLRCASGAMQGCMVWASERTGFMHLYLYNREGECLGALTAGDWAVETLEAVDEDAGRIFFTGTRDSPLESHLYVAPLSPPVGTAPPPTPRRLTPAGGRHAVVLDRGLTRFVDTADGLMRPPSVTLRSLADGSALSVIHPAPVAATGTTGAALSMTPVPGWAQGPLPATAIRLGLTPPSFFHTVASDGTPLHGAYYAPDVTVYGPGPYPTVVHVYGGPHVQVVSDTWAMVVDMRAQYLRSKGLLVLKLDNRGSARRGLAFEGTVKNDMGRAELDDQLAGVDWAVSAGLTDPSRVAIYGWSYGGYLAAMALAKAPGRFRAAVSGAPVTSWDGYDTHYTERYMGHPAVNAGGYESSSVLSHAGAITGKLLLVHGLLDENVHWRHTARLVKALTAAAVRYELMIFPDERHMPRGLRDRTYLEERVCDFLASALARPAA